MYLEISDMHSVARARARSTCQIQIGKMGPNWRDFGTLEYFTLNSCSQLYKCGQ